MTDDGERPQNRGESGGRDPTTGRFTPGNSGHGGGRPRLPSWLRERSEELLRLQVRAAIDGVVTVKTADGATTEEPVPVHERIAVAEKLLDRIHGRAAPAIDEDWLDRLEALERDTNKKE